MGSHGVVHVVTAEVGLAHFAGLPGNLEETARLSTGGGSPVVALDHCGRVHAAMGGMHAVVGDAEWWLDPTGVPHETVGSPSLAIDDRDVVHLAYVVGNRHEQGVVSSVGYVTIVDGVWSEEETIPGAEGVAGIALALDPSGAPVVAGHGDGRVLVASRDSGDWVVEIVDPEGNIDASPPALAIGADGTRHVVYVGRWLAYASNPGGEWVIRPLATNAYDPSAALDSNGGLHVAYFTKQGPTYATYREGVDGIDQNCDGVDGVDADGDGHASVETGGDDSDDLDPAVQ